MSFEDGEYCVTIWRKSLESEKFMNKCPKCQQIYDDRTLSFCLEDGEKLIPFQSSFYSTPTVFIGDQKNGSVYQPKAVKSKTTIYLTLAGASVLIIFLVTGVFGFWFLRVNYSPDKKTSNENLVKNSDAEKPANLNQGSPIVNKTSKCEVDTTVHEEFAKLIFPANSYKLSDESMKKLEGVAEKLKGLLNECKFEIGAHTDKGGNPDLNKKLTQYRADEIKNVLVKYGIKGDKIKAVGYGDTRPLSDGSSDSERAKNRRIELKLLK